MPHPPALDRRALRRLLVRFLDRLVEEMYGTPTAREDQQAEDVRLDLLALAELARLIEDDARLSQRRHWPQSNP